MNQKLEARQTVYRHLYDLKLAQPVSFDQAGAKFHYHNPAKIAAEATEPYRSLALSYAVEMGHLDINEGFIRLNAYGEQFAEEQGWTADTGKEPAPEETAADE